MQTGETREERMVKNREDKEMRLDKRWEMREEKGK